MAAVNVNLLGPLAGVCSRLSLSFFVSAWDSMLVVFNVLKYPLRLQPKGRRSSLVHGGLLEGGLNVKVKVAAVGDKFSLHPPCHIPIPFTRVSSVSYLSGGLAVRTSPKIVAAFL